MQPSNNPLDTRWDTWVLVAALAAGLCMGLVYVFGIPAWQHYDEPNHFEYVWLLAHRDGAPQTHAQDQQLQRALVASMIANGFYRDLGYVPDLQTGQQVSIGGYSQLDEPAPYYWLASLPLRFFSADAPLEAQLHAARLVSLLFFLATILAGWGIARELSPPRQALRWLLPFSVALLPGLIDLMTAVNNDAAAILAFSWLLWGGVRLIRRGLNGLDLAWTALATLACYFINNTVLFAFPVLVLVILFSVLRDRRRWIAWSLTAAGVLVAVAVSLSWGDASLWYRSSAQAEPTRVRNSSAVAGEHVFQIDPSAPVTPNWSVPLFQPLDPSLVKAERGRNLTLGVWMWADQPIQARLPFIYDGTKLVSQGVSLTDRPAFFTVPITVSLSATRSWVSLNPQARNAPPGVKVYYDGLVLAEGRRPVDQPPLYAGGDASQGEWGGEPFKNLLRNASAEAAGPRIRPALDDLGALVLPDHIRPALILTSLLDGPGAGWYYQQSALSMLRTFWASFGWGNVPLSGHRPYRWLGIFTLVSLVGALVALVRKRRQLDWGIVAVLVFTLFMSWGPALVRGPVYLGNRILYLPVARYAYPTILPSLLALNLGWLEWAHLAGRFNRAWFSSGIGANFQKLRQPVTKAFARLGLQPGANLFGVIVFLCLSVWFNWVSIQSWMNFWRPGGP